MLLSEPLYHCLMLLYHSCPTVPENGDKMSFGKLKPEGAANTACMDHGFPICRLTNQSRSLFTEMSWWDDREAMAEEVLLLADEPEAGQRGEV